MVEKLSKRIDSAISSNASTAATSMRCSPLKNGGLCYEKLETIPLNLHKEFPKNEALKQTYLIEQPPEIPTELPYRGGTTTIWSWNVNGIRSVLRNGTFNCFMNKA